MKFKSFIFQFLLFAAFSTYFTISMGAQTESVPRGAYCDDLISKEKLQMNELANQECRTVKQCIECVDRKTNEVMYVTMVVQPTSAKCRPVPHISITEAPASRGDKPEPVPFPMEILQSHCIKGGTSLEVFIPGACADAKEYSFLWEVDGNKGGHEPSVECVCGSRATVRVTHLATGRQATKSVKLHPCSPSDK